MVAFRYHGNYVGPGWSAGRYQSSVARSSVPAVDEFDATAKRHDRAYALKKNLKQADYRFYRSNIGKGLKRTAAAIAVGVQGLLRKPNVSRFGYKRPNRNVPSFLKKKKGMAPVRRKRSGSSSSSGGSRYEVAKRMRGYKVMRKRKAPAQGGPARKRINYKRTPRRGARFSRYGGTVRPARQGKGVLDKHAVTGIVTVREVGGVASGTLANKVQTFGFHQATAGKDQLIIDVAYAFAKTLCQKIFGIACENIGQVINYAAGRDVECKLGYRTNPTAAILYFNYNIVAGDTVKTLGDQIATHWKILFENSSNVTFISLVCSRKIVGTAPNVGWEHIGSFDLRRSRISYYAKSELKLQNRTISTAGNDEADDVDNVPLSGRTYDGTGNYFRFQDVIFQVTVTQQTNMTVTENVSGSGLIEPPPLGHLRRMKKVSPIRLQPGEIKQSNLVDSGRMGLVQWAYHLGKNESTNNMLTFGKQRFIMLEKMLQSVATTDTNAMKIAYEIQMNFGVTVTLAKQSVTTQVVAVNPL